MDVAVIVALASRKWSELLRYMNHRPPNAQFGHIQLQRAILGEEALAGSICDLRQGSRNVPVLGGDLGGKGIVVRPSGVVDSVVVGDGVEAVDVHNGYYFVDSHFHSDNVSDDEQRPYEDPRDPLSADDLERFQHSSAEVKAEIYGAMRTVVRRYGAITGKFGPRRCKGPTLKMRFRRKGRWGAGGNGSTGFFVGEMWVSCGHVSEDGFELFVNGGKGGKGSKSRSTCFNCGRPGHWARE